MDNVPPSVLGRIMYTCTYNRLLVVIVSKGKIVFLYLAGMEIFRFVFKFSTTNVASAL